MNIKKINIKSFSLCIILSTFLHQYASFLPGVSFGEMMLILTSVFVLLFDGFDLKIDKTKILVQFYGVCMLLTLLSFLLQQHDFIAVSSFEVFSRWVRYFAYVIFIVISAEKMDLNDRVQSSSQFC